jgi:hypothetical protein
MCFLPVSLSLSDLGLDGMHSHAYTCCPWPAKHLILSSRIGKFRHFHIEVKLDKRMALTSPNLELPQVSHQNVAFFLITF